MSSLNEPLALAELNIPGRTGPMWNDPKVFGINIAAALGNFPLNGLLCGAGPWGNMAAGDRLIIYWGTGQNVWVETVDKNEVGAQLRMFVPSRHMVDGLLAVSYVVRPLGGTDQPSEVMQVLVKLTRPGGHDDNGDGGHSKLIMTIPKEIADGGIDEENVADGVPITIGKNDGTPPYPFAAAGDVCRISWGGIFVHSEPLTEEQAQGKTPIIVNIEEADIREAGDADSPGVAVVFEVYDCVFNRSEDWSAEQRVVVAVDATRAGAPLLKETVNNVLDVDKLGDANGTVQIIAMDKNKFQVGDIVFIRIKGTPVEGPPIDWEPSAGVKLKSVPSIMEIMAPNAVLRQLAKSQITLSYRLEKADGSADLRSKSQFIRAIGEVQRLAAPIVLDAVSGALDPDLKQVRLEIPFDKSFVEGQVLKIFMLGTTPGLDPYLPDLPPRPITRNDIVEAKPLLYNIDGKHLAPVNGGTAEFYYQQLIADAVLAALDPFEATHAIRESIHTQILQVGEPRLELPEPVVAGVVEGVLPADTDGTTLTVVYTKTVDGDEVFMFWTGSITGEYPDSIKLNESTAGKEVPFTIDARWIKGNEGGTVLVKYHIKRADGRMSYAEPLEFSVGVALDLKAPKIKEAPNDVLQPIEARNTLTAVIPAYENMIGTQLIVTWTGTADSGSHTTAPFDVTTQASQEITLPNSVVAFNLDKSVTVTYTMKRGDNPELPSETLNLTVMSLKLDLSHVPKILQAMDNGDGAELDLATISASAMLHAPDWPLIALGQFVWLRFIGVLANGYAYDRLYWQAPTAQTNEAWISDGFYQERFSDDVLNELKGLKEGSTLSIGFKTALSGSQNENEAVTGPVREYRITGVPTVEYEDFESVPMGTIFTSELPLVRPALTLRPTSSRGTNVSSSGPLPEFKDQSAWVFKPGAMHISLTRPRNYIVFGYRADYSQLRSINIDAVDENGLIIESKTLPNTAPRWVAFLSPADRKIKGIRIPPLSGVDQFVDTFTMADEPPPFEIDTSQIVLAGPNLTILDSGLDWPLSGIDPYGTTAVRLPTSGVSPYTFTSADDRIVSVDATGVIRSEGNGSTLVTVTDQLNRSATFTCVATNVRRIRATPDLVTGTEALEWASEQNVDPFDHTHPALTKFEPPSGWFNGCLANGSRTKHVIAHIDGTWGYAWGYYSVRLRALALSKPAGFG